MARKASANANRKRRQKPKINRSDPAQSERFIEAARNASMDETGETFERAFGKIVPPRQLPNHGKASIIADAVL
jgi:hypothetical protein